MYWVIYHCVGSLRWVVYPERRKTLGGALNLADTLLETGIPDTSAPEHLGDDSRVVIGTIATARETALAYNTLDAIRTVSQETETAIRNARA